MATPYISRVILFTTALALCLEAVQPQYYHGKDVKGPPTKTADTVKKIARIGDSVKLNCPIEGYPEPLFDWSKNDENIDFMWERHKIRGRSLRIRNVNEDDTGIFICKGINGFGSDSVRVELIVVGKRKTTWLTLSVKNTWLKRLSTCGFYKHENMTIFKRSLTPYTKKYFKKGEQ